MKVWRVAAAAGLVLAAAAAAIYYHPPFRLGALALAGRSPECPLSQAIRSAAHARELMKVKDRILAASRELEKDPAGFHLWDTPKGRYWVPAGSDYALPFNLAEQELKIYGAGERAVQPGDVVLDCGANIGVYVWEALESKARLVVAIEPAPENLEALKRNFAPQIASGKVIIYPKGVWDKDDFLTLNVDPANSAADSFVIRREGARAVARVPLTTIDRLVEELKLDRVDYIKMDIEGAEPNALEGARRTLARWRPRLSISAYHAEDHPRRIPAVIRAIVPGYRMACGPCAEAGGRIRPDVLYFW